MATYAVSRAASKIDDLLPEQSGLADQRLVETLLPRFAQEAGALLFVEIDEDRIGIGALELDDVGREVRLTRLGGNVGDNLDTAGIHLLVEIIATTLAEVVVHPQHADGLGLDAVTHVVGDLRHTELLSERGSENVRIAFLRDRRSFTADNFRDFRLLGQQHVDEDRTREDRTDNDVGLV